ncbi:MAG: alanine--tRNA ligase, partial [Candidatus Aenigmatarchaeota archaeon]
MLSKDAVRARFSAEPDKYYRVALFDELGFQRRQCACGKWFWTLNPEQTKCPDPPCTSYNFIGQKIGKLHKDYVETWRAIERFFVKNGHTAIPSYPTVCRWFPGLYFTIASIVAFQRSVGGEPVFEFPANPLIIPQVCLRFNDIPNVGVSGRHHTSFIMIGQHSLHDGKSGYWKDRCIELDWQLLTKVLGIPQHEISFVEDVWVGPSAFGYSLEYFVRGLELGNAVFTEFIGTPEQFRVMEKKIIDMGAGHERLMWLLSGQPTSYDSAFGPVMADLKKKVQYDSELFSRYAPLAGNLNVGEVADVAKARADIAWKLGVTPAKMQASIEQLEAAYAIADHSKTLLYAITDGQLPSNVGGGYNLRVILRRALGFIDKFKLDINLADVCAAHAKYLKKLDSRLKDSLSEVREIIGVEAERFNETKQRTSRTISALLERKVPLDAAKLNELYESQGITPELIAEVAASKNIRIDIPADVYVKMTERHMGERTEEPTKIDVRGFPPTRMLFYEDPKMREFDARVLKIIDGKWVVLDRTAFYGRAGGQEPDHGTLSGCGVYDVEKIGEVIAHGVENIAFAEGDVVHGVIDWARREQITRHHTAAHVINAAARRVLGRHVWQHSAFKDVDRARLDITHYAALDAKQVAAIEAEANKIVRAGKRLKKHIEPRIEAESEHGFGIYQGGAIPHAELRIISIPGVDVEACGGTHTDSTRDIGEIVILGTERVQDGVVRINFVAGPAAERVKAAYAALVARCSDLLGVPREKVIDAAKKVFEEWKSYSKLLEKSVADRGKQLAAELDGKFVNNVLIERIEGADAKLLQEVSRALSGSKRLIILFGVKDQVSVFVSAGEESGASAGAIAREACAA